MDERTFRDDAAGGAAGWWARRRDRRQTQLIWGVPARIMRPRLLFLAAVFFLLAFGLLMVYSASSVVALSDWGDPLYYLERQAIFAAVGIFCAWLIGKVGYRELMGNRKLLTVVILGALFIVFTPLAGHDANGASRWISWGGFTFQPSEFAKPVVILCFASLAEHYWGQGTLDKVDFRNRFLLEVAAPLVLILAQPDKGTTMVLGLTLLVMAYLAGASGRGVGIILALLVVGFFAISLIQPYSRARFLTMLDPWRDEFGSGYQLIQGFYAFGSGGLLGRGIGMSHQKYSYLPMAYNDFVFAVIGEECGLVGTLAVLAGFAVLLWAGYQIAKNAADQAGRLIALGSSVLLFVQMLLNVTGVIGVFPLSGKPIPFISYGGSSILATLILVGLVFSVSKESRVSLAEYDGRGRGLRVLDGSPMSDARGPAASPGPERVRGAAFGDSGQVGQPTLRSQRPRPARNSGLTLVEGGRSVGAAPAGGGRTSSRTRGAGYQSRGRQAHPDARITVDSQGRERIDLGPSPSDRLRIIESQPRLRGRGAGKDPSQDPDSKRRS